MMISKKCSRSIATVIDTFYSLLESGMTRPLAHDSAFRSMVLAPMFDAIEKGCEALYFSDPDKHDELGCRELKIWKKLVEGDSRGR